MNAMWVNPFCARCKGTAGVRTGIHHRSETKKLDHLVQAEQNEVRETVRSDGLVFRWPAPSLDPPTDPKHPDGTCADAVLLGRPFAVWANITTAVAVQGLENGSVTWSELLLCRVFNALDKTDPGNIRHHLRAASDLIEEWTEELDRRIG